MRERSDLATVGVKPDTPSEGDAMRATRLLLTLALLASADTFAQSTSWGDPDLQGVWSNLTPVPLERPGAMADKPFFTPAEAAEVEKNALATVLKNVEKQIPTSGEFNEVWL